METLQELLRMNSDAPHKTKATSLADGQPTSSSLLPVSTPLTREYEDEEEEEDNLSVADLFMFKSHVQSNSGPMFYFLVQLPLLYHRYNISFHFIHYTSALQCRNWCIM